MKGKRSDVTFFSPPHPESSIFWGSKSQWGARRGGDARNKRIHLGKSRAVFLALQEAGAQKESGIVAPQQRELVPVQ